MDVATLICGRLSFKDGLVDFADNKERAVRILKEVVCHGGNPFIKYAKKMSELLFNKDGHACQRIYNDIID